MLMSVKILNMESIQFHRIERFTSDSEKHHPKFDISQVPVYMQVDHVNTDFIYMFVLMDTTEVSRSLRPYLLLLLESLLESPVQRGAQLVPYEEVVAGLEADTMAAVTRLGLEPTSRFQCGPYCQTISLMLLLEPNKYERCIIWIRELLYQTKLTAERLKIIATMMVNDVAQWKMKGNSVVRDLMKGLMYNKESNHYATSVLRQHKFLTTLLERLNNPEECQRVLTEMDQLRQIVTQPSNMVVHLAANLEMLGTKYPDPANLWNQLLPSTRSPARNKLRVTPDWELLLDPVACPLRNCVVGIGGLESSFFCQTAPAIKDFRDPELAPLLVFLKYLTQHEGPMWRVICGRGYAYSYNMIPRPNEGLLYLTFDRATDILEAYIYILESMVAGNVTWEEPLFELAKSSCIYEIIKREKGICDVINQSLLFYFNDVDHDYNRWLIQEIDKVTMADLTPLGPKYVKLLFDPSISYTSIVCRPSEVEELKTGFEELGFELTAYPTQNESFLNEW